MPIRQPHELALIEWVRASVLTLTDVLFSNNKQSRLVLPYATVNVLVHGTLGTPQIETTDVPNAAQFDEVRSMPQQGSVSINMWGDGANGLMDELQESMHSPSIVEVNENAGIVIAQVVNRLDAYADRSASFERRSQADFMFRHIRTRTEPVHIIDNMVLTPTIN